MKVHYPKLYNMAHLFTFNAFTDFKGSNNYILINPTLYLEKYNVGGVMVMLNRLKSASNLI